MEERRRVIRACTSSRDQVSRRSGRVFGKKGASVPRTSKDAQVPMLLGDLPSLDPEDDKRTGLTKTGQEPGLFCKNMGIKIFGRLSDHGQAKEAIREGFCGQASLIPYLCWRR